MKSHSVTRHDALDAPSALLPQDPPPLIARLIAWLLISLFALFLVVAVAVPLPETVRCDFILVPKDGSDPIQAPYQAVVQTVNIEPGQEVAAGDVLFVLRSDEVRLQRTRLNDLREDLQASLESAAKLEATYRAELSINDAVMAQAKKEVEFREHHSTTYRELMTRINKLAATGGTSLLEQIRYQLLVAESKKDWHLAQRSLETVRLERLRIETERARQRGEERAKTQKITHEIESLEQVLGTTPDVHLMIRAPYRAVVISVAQRTPGTVVAPGAELCQLAQLEATAEARLLLTESGLPRIAEGQQVRLFFEAYPYQRYGTVSARLQWISPAAVQIGDDPRFIAISSLDQPDIVTHGQSRPLRVGMKGTARILVGRRTLIEYAFEPLRRLQEDLRHD